MTEKQQNHEVTMTMKQVVKNSFYWLNVKGEDEINLQMINV